MSTTPNDNPLDPDFQAWCIQQYHRLAEGGVWAVPRSGMVFAKREGGFVLIAEMPWMEEMAARGITPAALREQQDEEFALIRRHFAAVDIPVTRAEQVYSDA